MTHQFPVGTLLELLRWRHLCCASALAVIVGAAPGTNRITDECNYENNSATITVPRCIPPPK
jgi:hypothetical protein